VLTFFIGFSVCLNMISNKGSMILLIVVAIIAGTITNYFLSKTGNC
jgi:hypothetical protein